MRMNDMGDGAELSLLPEDLDGTYDYIPDVVSMAAGSNEQLQQATQNAVAMLTTNPVVLQLLQAQGVTPQIKDLLISVFDQAGLKDAERFFQSQGTGQPMIQSVNGQPGQAQAQIGGGNGPINPLPQQGVPNAPPAPLGQGQPAAMAGPPGPGLPA